MAKSYIYELWKYGYAQVQEKWEQKWTLVDKYDHMEEAKAMMQKLDEEENGDHPMEREDVCSFKILKKKCAKRV